MVVGNLDKRSIHTILCISEFIQVPEKVWYEGDLKFLVIKNAEPKMAKVWSPKLVMAGPEGHIVSQKCGARNGKTSVPKIFNDRAQGSHSLSKMQAPIWEKMVPKIGIGMA